VTDPASPATTQQAEPPPAPPTRRLAWAASILLLVAIAASLAIVIAYRHYRPDADTLLRNRLVASLSARFNSPVELDSLHLDTSHGLHVVGRGLRILYLAGPTKPDADTTAPPPMLQVAAFEFNTDFADLFKPTMRVVTVFVQGMQLNIPPHPRVPRHSMPDDPHRKGQPLLGITVDKIVLVDSKVTLETNTPGKLPLTFNIANLTLTDVGQDKPFTYDATLINPKPVGTVRSTGHFGPWQKDNPRDTPLDGSYWFLHADLSSIKGVSGDLSSSGNFSGKLSEIDIAGSADIPNFHLDLGDHPVPLHTDFNAQVNGLTGDTTLHRVDVRVLHSHLIANGSIVRVGTPATGVTGHDTELDVTMDHGRIEDMLLLAVKTNPPVLRGAMVTHQRLSLPPGKQSVSEKLHLDGSFTITRATFSNPNFQQTIDKLAARAQGHPEQANPQQASLVTSTLTGRFTQANAVVDVADLQMTLPGASGDLQGRYSLDGQAFNFHGTIRTQATASQMTTGWKRTLLRPFDSLLKRNGAGLEIPITITGTKSAPKFGIDTKRLFE
jgi:hypothetical protein